MDFSSLHLQKNNRVPPFTAQRQYYFFSSEKIEKNLQVTCYSFIRKWNSQLFIKKFEKLQID